MPTATSRLLAIGLAVAVAAPAAAQPPSYGNGWPELRDQVAGFVAEAMAENKIVGMTVAVSVEGRVVLAYGYGHSFKNGDKVAPMRWNHRTPIGSVSKALISGPATWLLARKQGLDPSKARLYGSDGIFKGDFDPDVSRATSRFERIVGLAIENDDTVRAWYFDGKVSSGWSRKLDSKSSLEPFVSARGKTPRDIVGMDFAGSTNKLYTWYLDGTRSVGIPADLGRYEQPDTKLKVKLPPGLSMVNIVGIAIRKSDDRVLVWYDDGTLSAGTSLDFTKEFAGRIYKPPGGRLRYQIIDMALAKNDWVYAWYARGQTATGSSTDLEKYRKLAPFEDGLPPRRAADNSYNRITLQNVLDHRAGFQRDGSVAEAAVMNDRAAKDLRYEDVHRHFLATRSLLREPGTGYSYSNHGMGLTTLLVQYLSPTGDSYYSHVVHHYLGPLGLNGSIRPRGGQPDQTDAYLYDVRNDQVVARDFSDTSLSTSTIGLAAGGWSASAHAMLQISHHLAANYPWSDINRMAWGGTDSGKLSHNGATGGGTAYICMFPKGYTSSSTGGSLSEVHVAVATNTGGVSTSELAKLADAIALAVPKAGIPPGYTASLPKPIH